MHHNNAKYRHDQDREVTEFVSINKAQHGTDCWRTGDGTTVLH
jgi:hypothetical protein